MPDHSDFLKCGGWIVDGIVPVLSLDTFHPRLASCQVMLVQILGSLIAIINLNASNHQTAQLSKVGSKSKTPSVRDD
jgi:hypothetical protein